MARKTDKQCAQTAIAAAVVTGTKGGTADAIKYTLTHEEIQRAQAYLKSGKPVTGS